VQSRMIDGGRRRFLRLVARAAESAAAFSFLPLCIQRALALPASNITGTIADVQHVVILMQENRSFDHYFGTLRGVRGFGDRHPIPLLGRKPVWFQSDGEREIAPFRLNTKTTSALRTPGTPHTFSDAQAAWSQGQLNLWPKFKTAMSMGHYYREDIPFQYALADAFTICDAYHCSVTTGTDPNRIVFFSGSNFDPERQRSGENCTDKDAEVNNLRCLVKGALPTPGYFYQGSPLTWSTIPDALEAVRVSWRIYQDPNDNWTGLMHGGLAFQSFRDSAPGTALYDKGMSHWSLEQFAQDVQSGTLPQVSWILPPMSWSEHPSPSSSLQGAEFTSQVLQALTANPDIWGKTVLFLTFDENDGLFDHVPPPAPPSYNLDQTLAGKSTVSLIGEYFSDPERKYLHAEDRVSGTVRPWGLGPRVPMYVISPWSRGGWVNSQVFDHTSVGQFLEKRFGITIPAISPWHRAVCGNLSSAFNFVTPNEPGVPELSLVRDADAALASSGQRTKPTPPGSPEPLFQEPGVRRSRALPYELQVHARVAPKAQVLALEFHNSGRAGAVFHVYDRLHLDLIPRRYTVEAGRSLRDDWLLREDQGCYDLWVYGPNGFVREFRGNSKSLYALAHARLEYDVPNTSIRLVGMHHGRHQAVLSVHASAYRTDGPWPLRIVPGRRTTLEWSLIASHGWYDFTVGGDEFVRRFAGRMETGAHGFSDPAV
jgi:phospholipase C